MKTDVIVIGAGIIGAACAAELAACGLDVLVLDAGTRSATNAGMGHIVVMDDNPAEFTLTSVSQQIWQTWSTRMSASCAFAAVGTLWLAANNEEMAAADAKQSVLREQGVVCEMLDGSRLARAEPAVRSGMVGALRVPGDSVVYAPSVVRWLLSQSPRRIQVRKGEVTAIEDRVVCVNGGETFEAQAVLLASGLECTKLCPDLPIRAKKGHLAITDRYPGTVNHQLIELGYISGAHHSDGTSVAFNVQPRPTGQLLIGSSRQFDTLDASVEPDMLERMLTRALMYLPALGSLNIIRSWTGFRAATPDNLPIIGEHPRHKGLWLAVGHEGLGVTTAPATARLLAAQMCGAALPFAPEPYSLHRFLEAA